MILKIKVKPHSGRSELVFIEKDVYIAYLKNIPENNKANKELLALIKKYFKRKIIIKNIKIIKGLSSRNKIVEIIE